MTSQTAGGKGAVEVDQITKFHVIVKKLSRPRHNRNHLFHYPLQLFSFDKVWMEL